MTFASILSSLIPATLGDALLCHLEGDLRALLKQFSVGESLGIFRWVIYGVIASRLHLKMPAGQMEELAVNIVNKLNEVASGGFQQLFPGPAAAQPSPSQNGAGLPPLQSVQPAPAAS